MSVNFSKTEVFNNFLKKSGVHSVSENFPIQQKNYIASVKIDDISDESIESGSGKKKLFGIIGASVGSVALLTLIALFTLSKGFSEGFDRKFTKFSQYVKKNISELSFKSKELTPFEYLKLQMSKAIKPAAEILEASANITAIKDSLMNRFLKKIKMESFVSKINIFFKDYIVLATKNNAYKKAELSLVKFGDYLEKVAKNENNSELLILAEDILKTFDKAFSTKAHMSRTDKNWLAMSNLSDRVFDELFKPDEYKKVRFGKFLGKNGKLRTYVTNDMSENLRIELKKELHSEQDLLISKMKKTLELVPKNRQDEVKSLFVSVDKNLKKAIVSEVKAFNKLAEIQVGSVATDIIGILIPAMLATFLIIDSENKKERIGTALTKGIPIFGGLGVSYYGTTRGFTGAKNLALGLSTAGVLNILGVQANNYYKKTLGKINNYIENEDKFGNDSASLAD